MKTIINQILSWYSLIFTFFILVLGVSFNSLKDNSSALLTFVLILVYFGLSKILRKKTPLLLLLILALVCYCLATIICLLTLITAKTTLQIFTGIAFSPLVFFFSFELIESFKILFSRLSQLKIKKTVLPTKSSPVSSPHISDQNRRNFLKMAGSTGLGILALSLLEPKKAGAAFFGSVPGPGTISIKDTDGNKINPAAQQPTDGYKISKIDDTSSDTYSYYGFVDQNGQWYIQRETTSGVSAGTFLYYKGTTDFPGNWTTRVGFIYDDFNDIF